MADLPAIARLLLIAAGCAVLLSLTHWLTEARIADNRTAKAQQDLLHLLDGATGISLTDLPDVTSNDHCWTLDDSGLRLLRLRAPGYGGPIEVLFTLDRDRLGRLRVTGHQETPGIADFLNRPGEGWLAGLHGRDLREIETLDTVTGATITSRALLAAVSDALKDTMTAEESGSIPDGTAGEPPCRL